MPTQYPYPEQGWSTGNMRMAKIGPMRDTGREFRELEGERKKKESKVSELKGGHNDFPELHPGEARAYWEAWNRDLQTGAPSVMHEPTDAQGVQDIIDKFGHGFFSATGSGAQEFMKNMPSDVESYRVPLKGMFPDTEYPESSRLLYFRRGAKTSEASPGPEGVG